jgi:GrpB-like predicted nucleotidyltransferase (UPF0157 family)
MSKSPVKRRASRLTSVAADGHGQSAVVSEADEVSVWFLPEAHFRTRVLQRFEQLKAELAVLIPDADIQHVGSTAIPGSLTKGDLDIQIRVVAATYPIALRRHPPHGDWRKCGYPMAVS